jgi:hypothetical protein
MGFIKDIISTLRYRHKEFVTPDEFLKVKHQAQTMILANVRTLSYDKIEFGGGAQVGVL